MQKDAIPVNQGKKYANLNQSYLDRLEWYNLPKWKAIRKQYLVKHPICCICGAPAEIVDHKKGHDPKTWKKTFFDSSNFQAMCWSCHSRKTCLEDMRNKPKRLTAEQRFRQLQKLKEK